MNVAIDVRVLATQSQRAGIAQYVVGLFRGYQAHRPQDMTYIPLSMDARGLDDLPERPVIIPARRPLPWQTVLVPWALRRQPYDVFHGPAFTVPPGLSMPRVVTIHDLAFWRYPESVTDDTRAYLKRVVPLAIQRAARVIVPSSQVRQDLLEFYPRLSPERIRVIPLGGDRLPPGADTPPFQNPYVLFVGTMEPRKNLSGLLRAWELFQRQSHAEWQLILVGGRGWKTEALWDQVKRREDIVYRGYLDDRELATYLRHAVFLVEPSFYEGFGLPVVEALHQGTSVVATPTGIARDLRHPLLTVSESSDPEALASAMLTAISTRARDASPVPTWRDSFRQHAALYSEVIYEK
ncbi:glycosyl transferase group 1 [Sulfobacillus acidophilus TPY]|uniref:Glycosyl transferase group 1 n=1 Tax=Sulfobacillus acidophilus (strain ATCC 700253 / DSM 10332 / NAL) TaxID=679936 RepID=G8TSV5_SULAD|nr:glycosyl transferase group 1 [Sulfobacillus acidophilus TPY]AEW05570.1 glycosyl transferase group 1 [Sulfobacillus acidophilus DSM 10332]